MKADSFDASVTAKFVKRLNEISYKEVRGWVQQGAIIAEFLALLPPRTTRDAAYKILASHPDSIHKVAQLRNFYECREVFLAVGGVDSAPSMRMTFYIAVMSKKLTTFKQKELLEMAKAEKWTVAQIKKVVQMTIRKDPIAVSHDIPPEQIALKFAKRSDKIVETAIDLCTLPKNVKMSNASKEMIFESIKKVNTFLAKIPKELYC